MKPKRPVTVWIAQIVLAIYGVGTLLLALYGLAGAVTGGVANPELFMFVTLASLTFSGLFLFAFWGMALGKAWGRWLGVAGLLLLTVAGAITQTSRLFSRSSDQDGSQPFGLVVIAILIVVGLAVLVYQLSAGDKVEEFFAGKPSVEPPSGPPPPPTFDT